MARILDIVNSNLAWHPSYQTIMEFVHQYSCFFSACGRLAVNATASSVYGNTTASPFDSIVTYSSVSNLTTAVANVTGTLSDTRQSPSDQYFQ